MKYTTTVRRPDGTEFESAIDTSAGNKQAVELAKNLAESYGFELVGLESADGEEIPVGNDDQNKDTEERVDEQNKTTTERVEEQRVETKEVTPDKTGDVKPNR